MNDNINKAKEVMTELRELFSVESDEEAIEKLSKVPELTRRMNEVLPLATGDLKNLTEHE